MLCILYEFVSIYMLCLIYIIYCMYILFKQITRMEKLPAFGHIGWLTHKVSVFHFISYTISLTYMQYMLSILCILYIVFISAYNSSCARDTGTAYLPMSPGCRRWAQDADDELRMPTMSSGCRRWARSKQWGGVSDLIVNWHLRQRGGCGRLTQA
jgi:hypothetical protein